MMLLVVAAQRFALEVGRESQPTKQENVFVQNQTQKTARTSQVCCLALYLFEMSIPELRGEL